MMRRGSARWLLLSAVVCCCLCDRGITRNADKDREYDVELNTIDTSHETTSDFPSAPQGILYRGEVRYLACPPREESQASFYALPCDSSKDCAFLDGEFVCCGGRCLKGIPVAPVKPKPRHSPTFFGLLDRVCPLEPLVEIFPVKQCLTDNECFPRICCPEGADGSTSYCRTPTPNFDQFPGNVQFFQPLKTFISYMQCTPAPPPFLDFFPKPCRTQLDCFPNLCCQEKDKKYCRPPKRSILGLLAGVSERFGGSEIAKKFLERIN